MRRRQRAESVTPSLIHFVVALDAEAKPIISWFGLRRVHPDRGFPLFRHAHVALVVSGPGKANAAAAAAHLHAACGFPRDALWINIGIAGHPQQPAGETFVIHALEDVAAGRRWFPPLAVTPPWPGERLLTLDRPDTTYRHGALVDMEAAGFYATACRFSTAELVHCIKVVSDNADQPASRLSAQDLTALIGTQLDALDLFLHRLGRLANELADEALDSATQAAPYLARWHFTDAQRRQLNTLLDRWQVVFPQAPPWPTGIEDAASAAAAIERLAAIIQRQPLTTP